MRILIVKLSSLGDVVHAMPSVQDLRRCLPDAEIDWVVERAFAPLVARVSGIGRVIAVDLRRWRRKPWAAQTRAEWRAFRADLRAHPYDVVLDLQGLSKSALVSWMARTSAKGQRYAMGNRTDGSAWEAPTRWVADTAIPLEPHVHALTRARWVCARALGYALPADLQFGLIPRAAPRTRTVVFVHGSSRADKLWPRAHWVALGQRLNAQGLDVALVHGTPSEYAASVAIAEALERATVWPTLGLSELTDALAPCAGVIGVDSGISHLAVALGLAHVQVYNFDTAWRTGPQMLGRGHQCSVFATPHPALEAVWTAWVRLGATP